MRCFIRSVLGAGVPVLQLRKLSSCEVNLLTQSSRLVRAPSHVYLLGSATAVLSKAPGQGCSSQPALCWCFFSFCFLSDQSPFWGPSCLPTAWWGTAGGRKCGVCGAPWGWRGQLVRWVHRGHSRNSAPPLSGHGAWPRWAQCLPSPAQCPGRGRGVTGSRNS